MLSTKFVFDHYLVDQLSLTSHAVDRSIQRKIPTEQIHLVFLHGDLKCSAANGRTECQISHQAAMKLRRANIGPKNISLLTNLVLIVTESGRIVTVYRR